MLKLRVKKAIRKQQNTIDSLHLALRSANLSRWRFYVKKKTIKITDSNLNQFYSVPEKYYDLIHDEDKETYKEFISDILNGKKRESIIIKCNINNPEYLPYEIHANLKCDKNGNPDVIDGIAIDISKLYSYQQQLNEKILLLEESNSKLEANNKILESKEAEYKNILNKLPIPIFIKDGETLEFEYINEKAISTFFQKTNFANSIEEINRQPQGKEYTYHNKVNIDLIETGNEYTAYEQIKIDDETYIDTYVKKSVVEINNRKKLLIVRFDILEQNKSRIAKKILSSSLGSFKAYTWSVDSRNGIIIYNEGIDKTKSKITRIKNFEAFFNIIHHDDIETTRNQIEDLLRKESGQSTIFYRLDIDNDNNYEWWESRMIVETLNDRDVSYKLIYGINININETKTNEISLKNSRQELLNMNKQNNLILNHIDSALIYFNSDYEIVWSNAESVLGNIVSVFYSSKHKCNLVKNRSETICRSCPVSETIAEKKVHKSIINLGQNGVFEATSTPINDANGNFEGVVLRIDDITVRHNLINDLTIAKEKAEESERLKGIFLANMSHEIRTPLNSIIGFSQYLQYSQTPEEHEQYLGIINKNSDLLLRIIDNILDFSKLEAGDSENLHHDDYDIVPIFDDTYISFKSQISPKINFIKESGIKSCITNLNNTRIEQIMNNFISNAMKYTESGEIIMKLEHYNNGIKFSVRDTGIGIDKKYHNLIFSRFEKLDSYAPGSGLGLAICKAITSSMNGDIGFESEPNKGSLFWAWLPLKNSDSMILENNIESL